MAPANLPSVFNATSQDIEMLLAAQSHLGSKNLQVHMNPYLWKTRYVFAFSLALISSPQAMHWFNANSLFTVLTASTSSTSARPGRFSNPTEPRKLSISSLAIASAKVANAKDDAQNF